MSRAPYSAEIAAKLAQFDTGTVHEAGGDDLGSSVRALTSEGRVAGPALTVLCPAGDNLSIHHAVARAAGGDVLVVQSGDASFGVWGEVLTVAAQAKGVVALVLDGSARDLDSIRERGFPVWARGAALHGCAKNTPGEVGAPILCAGRLVRTGDYVVADVSGVVRVAPEKAETVLAAAASRRAKELEMIDRLRSGATTLELLHLPPEAGAAP